MLNGIFTAVIVSTCWIILQNLWMHVRPAKNRFVAMTTGYLLSLPFLFGFYILVARANWFPSDEPWGIGLLHAFISHLLIYMLYVECFYHVERSVTLRFLVEILRWKQSEAPTLTDIQGDYNIHEMIQRRLEVLQQNRFLGQENGRFNLMKKGLVFARVMTVSCWIFQSKTQDQRIQ